MDIKTAIKKAMSEGNGITKPGLDGFLLLPTNTAYGIIGCNKEVLKPNWQLTAEDLVSEEWETVSI